MREAPGEAPLGNYHQGRDFLLKALTSKSGPKSGEPSSETTIVCGSGSGGGARRINHRLKTGNGRVLATYGHCGVGRAVYMLLPPALLRNLTTQVA